MEEEHYQGTIFVTSEQEWLESETSPDVTNATSTLPSWPFPHQAEFVLTLSHSQISVASYDWCW